ncbi:MAG: xanthine phosphoribosyltransferase [Atopostipes suicloacalis]|nr:xanthine phosphoribosyltransferase [Atopostipes suicloacalis]
MSYLKEKITKDAIVLNESVLKVDSFLNHQIDPKVLKEVTNEIVEYFKKKEITKVMTIEASGIAPAIQIAAYFNVPMLFAKKAEPSTLENTELYETEVHSYTKNKTSRVLVSKKYLSADDKVLIIDDFLANGEAALGLIDLVKQADGEVAGVGICVEKSFQPGRQKLEDAGVDIYSICRVSSLKNNQVSFLDD